MTTCALARDGRTAGLGQRTATADAASAGRWGDHDDDRDGRGARPRATPPPAEQGACRLRLTARCGGRGRSGRRPGVRMALTSAGYSDIGQIARMGPAFWRWPSTRGRAGRPNWTRRARSARNQSLIVEQFNAWPREMLFRAAKPCQLVINSGQELAFDSEKACLIRAAMPNPTKIRVFRPLLRGGPMDRREFVISAGAAMTRSYRIVVVAGLGAGAGKTMPPPAPRPAPTRSKSPPRRSLSTSSVAEIAREMAANPFKYRDAGTDRHLRQPDL